MNLEWSEAHHTTPLTCPLIQDSDSFPIPAQ